MASYQYTPYIVPLLLGGIISAIAAFFLLRYKPTLNRRTGAALFTGGAIWMFAVVFELINTDSETIIFWSKIEYIGVVIVPVTFFIITMLYTGYEKWVTRKKVILLSVIPFITLILAFTNELHGLIWSNLTLITVDFGTVMFYEYGAWFWLYAAYSYMLLIISFVILIRSLINSFRFFRWQSIAMIAILTICWLANILYVFKLDFFADFDTTPIAFSISSLMLVFGISRLKMGDITPIARETIVESMKDAVIVLDDRNRIVYLNNIANNLFKNNKKSNGWLIGHYISEILPDCSDYFENISNSSEIVSDIIFVKNGQKRNYNIRINPIMYNARGKPPGKVVIIRDITNQKIIEKNLKRRIEFEKLIITLSTNFINIGINDIDNGINNALKKIGEFAGTDRSYVFLFTNDREKMSSTHEWCSEGIEPQIDRLKGMPVETFPWWMGKLNRLETIYIPHVSDLPFKANSEKEILQSQNTQSLIVVPIVYSESLIGFLGFDSVRTKRTFEKEIIALLKIVGSIFANALERKRIEEALIQSEERYRSLFENSADGMYRSTLEGNYIDANSALIKMLGYSSKDELLSINIPNQLYLSKKDRPPPGKREKPFEARFKKKDGSKIWAEVSSRVVYDEAGNPSGYEGTVRDITRRKEAEKKIKYMTFHDSLTGLYNRDYFEEELKRLDTERQLPLSLIVGDVDMLKVVNDIFGHDEGDKLLKKISKIIKDCCRKEDIITRWGGDEFFIILPKTNEKAVLKIVKRIRNNCVKDKTFIVPLSMSLGFSVKDNVLQNVKEKIIEAEDKMYRKKLFAKRSANGYALALLKNAVLKKGYETKEHMACIQNLAFKTGTALGLDSVKLDKLVLLTIFRNIGKLTIPGKKLNKESRLTKKELGIIKNYPEKGYRIALLFPETADIAEYILHQHERWDGTGYPRGLKGEEIPLLSRIIAIIGAYDDAVVHNRRHKETAGKKEAIEELKRCSGTQFDPKLVEKFIQVLEN